MGNFLTNMKLAIKLRKKKKEALREEERRKEKEEHKMTLYATSCYRVGEIAAVVQEILYQNDISTNSVRSNEYGKISFSFRCTDDIKDALYSKILSCVGEACREVHID